MVIIMPNGEMNVCRDCREYKLVRIRNQTCEECERQQAVDEMVAAFQRSWDQTLEGLREEFEEAQ